VSALSYPVALILMLGILIFVHELGHFLVAKACGVRVLKFSLGFGPTIGLGRFRLSWQRGGTEYVVAWLPLGGFVKMLGETGDPEDDPEARAHPEVTLGGKRTWQKLAIVFAGPAMNFLLPVAILAVSLALGVERPAPIVGQVEAGSPAAAAGIAPGDRVLAIDGQPVRWWDQVEERLRAKPGQTLHLAIEHEGARREVKIAVGERAGLDAFGGVAEVGWSGLGYNPLRAVVGVPALDSVAARAGLRSGDRVTALDGRPIEDWNAFAKAYAAAKAGSVALAVERGDEASPQKLELSLPARGSLAAAGIVPATVLIAKVTPDSPAARAGLAPGDLILAVDGAPVGSFFSFAETVRASRGRPLALTYARDGELHTVEVRAEKQEVENVLGVPETQYLIGISPDVRPLPGAVGLDIERNPLKSIPRAVGMTWELTTSLIEGLQKLVTGHLSPRQLSGPIGIAVMARNALELGWAAYLRILIVISVNLAVLNLLPIPVLDGGQAVLYTIEGVKRSPVSLRTREIVQQIGLTVLVLLMGLAFWNDISRHWTSFVDWLRGVGS
jgi:regulator of sigma E protease